MTSGTARKSTARAATRTATPSSRLQRGRLLWAGALIVVAVLVAVALLTTRSSSTVTSQSAPDFTLKATDGTSVTLSKLRGTPVVLYFNEGAGCGSCTVQMAQIEKDAAFAATGIRVLPIVMNAAAQITPDLARYQVKTPYLLDDGTVSKAYDELGKGMHAGLPGHGFVFIDKTGVQRWAGNYPSMWLPPADLLKEVQPYL